jgi:hypothetical protein
VSTRAKNARRGGGDGGEERDGRVVEPVVLRPFLQDVLKPAEESRHRDEAEPVEGLEQPEVRLVEVDQQQDRDGHDDSGHDIDEEQPVPREGVGEVAADGRADRGGERRHEPDQRRDDRLPGGREDQVGRGEHGRDHAPADEALQRTPYDHLVDRGRHAAHHARQREACGGRGEQDARAERARQEAGQRDGDDLGDQVGGLHPGDLVVAGREPRLNLGQRGRDDLDVQDRHEHPEHHGEKRHERARIDAIVGAGAERGGRHGG